MGWNFGGGAGVGGGVGIIPLLWAFSWQLLVGSLQGVVIIRPNTSGVLAEAAIKKIFVILNDSEGYSSRDRFCCMLVTDATLCFA
jgi:hypothetical protein